MIETGGGGGGGGGRESHSFRLSELDSPAITSVKFIRCTVIALAHFSQSCDICNVMIYAM